MLKLTSADNEAFSLGGQCGSYKLAPNAETFFWEMWPVQGLMCLELMHTEVSVYWKDVKHMVLIQVFQNSKFCLNA